MGTPRSLKAADSFDEGFPLEVMRLSQGDIELHSHEFSELVIVMAGSGRHTHPEGSYQLTAGDVFVLHGDQAHGYQDTKTLR